ncbi:MAG TPA: hypothetical protein VF190_09235 [Rhodothermales bacterium]
MEGPSVPERSFADMISRALLEIVDNNAHLMTLLDLQARLVAKAEGRDVDEVVAEVNEMLKARRREAIAEIEEWATGSRTRFDDGAQA